MDYLTFSNLFTLYIFIGWPICTYLIVQGVRLTQNVTVGELVAITAAALFPIFRETLIYVLTPSYVSMDKVVFKKLQN